MIVACHKSSDKDEVVDLGYAYYPVQVGATWIYQVDSLVYDNNAGFTTIDTFTYLYKEQVVSAYTDLEGKPAQYLNRFFKFTDTTDWVESNRWTLSQSALNAQKVQENIRFVKLVYPLDKQKKWNGNMYNALGEEEYEVMEYDVPKTVGGIAYDKTLTVLQKEELNAIEEIKRSEIYARNIGLVYLLSDSINTQVDGSKGYRFRLTLTSYTP